MPPTGDEHAKLKAAAPNNKHAREGEREREREREKERKREKFERLKPETKNTFGFSS